MKAYLLIINCLLCICGRLCSGYVPFLVHKPGDDKEELVGRAQAPFHYLGSLNAGGEELVEKLQSTDLDKKLVSVQKLFPLCVNQDSCFSEDEFNMALQELRKKPLQLPSQLEQVKQQDTNDDYKRKDLMSKLQMKDLGKAKEELFNLCQSPDHCISEDEFRMVIQELERIPMPPDENLMSKLQRKSKELDKEFWLDWPASMQHKRRRPLPELKSELKSTISNQEKLASVQYRRQPELNVQHACDTCVTHVQHTHHDDLHPGVVQTNEWPSGSYSLPMPREGCPPGFSEGDILQDTENDGTNFFFNTDFLHGYFYNRLIVMFYCTKTGSGMSNWPAGSYCIARHGGTCPPQFKEGSIHWDDENTYNWNANYGILPDGTYNEDTTINYCCRNDAPTYKAIQLPTSYPFVLYSFSPTCQRVAGMKHEMIKIHFDDENFHNQDSCSGSHPFSYGCEYSWSDHGLFLCHYSPYDQTV